MARSLFFGLACFALLVAAASATLFRVGGQSGWNVPAANAVPYNAWAGKERFLIGDQLLFVYPKGLDAVLLVDPVAYNACNTSSYFVKFDDGNTVFTLDRSGPFFFISGNEASCRANQKLIVVVLANHSPPPSSSPLPSPATPPSDAPVPGPAATPASEPTASPESSPPAPSTTGSTNVSTRKGNSTTTPTPPSSKDRNGASTVASGFVASLAAFVCYAMLAI